MNKVENWQVSKNEQGNIVATNKNVANEQKTEMIPNFRCTPSFRSKLDNAAKKLNLNRTEFIETAVNNYISEMADVENDIEVIDETIFDLIQKWQHLPELSAKEEKFLSWLNDCHEKLNQYFPFEPDTSQLTEFEKRELEVSE